MNQDPLTGRSPEQLAEDRRAWELAVEAFGGTPYGRAVTTPGESDATGVDHQAGLTDVNNGHEVVDGPPRQAGSAEHDLGAIAVDGQAPTDKSEDYLRAVDDALAVVAAGRALDEAERSVPLAPVHDIRTGRVIG